MFIHLLFFLISSDSYNRFDRFERRHYDNPNCEHFTITNGKITIDDFTGAPLYVLRDCQNFESVTLSSGIATIPDYTFYGSSIKKIEFPTSGFTTIGIGAFAHCTQLTDISLPTSLTTINEGAFFHAGSTTGSLSLESCTLLDNIGNSAFEECLLIKNELTFGTKPQTLQIGDRAFYGTSISKLTLPEIAKIGDYSFANCKSLAASAALNVGEIGEHAFSNSPLGGNLAITTTYVGQHAFSSTATSLKIIGIAQRPVTGSNEHQQITIGEYAFSGKTIACSLTFTSGTASQTINQYAFYNCIFNAANLNLQNVYIGDFAFANSSFNTACSLTLYKSIVGPHAFECTKGSSTLTLATSSLVTSADTTPADLQKYDIVFNEYCFYHSTALRSLNKQLYLSNAAYKSFAHCSGLETALTFRGDSIGNYAFANCTSLQGPVLIKGASVGQSSFEFCISLTKINITASYRDQPNNDADPNLKIEYRAFYGCSSLSSELILHEFIGSIGEYAFSRCTGLINTPITIYSDTIHPYAFADCNTLNGPIKIYSTTISFHAFDKNTLGTLTIDSKYDREKQNCIVQNEAFYKLKFTGPVTIKDHVVVNDYAFIYCTFANKLFIDADSVGKYSFSQCNASNSCNVSIGETTINEHAFEFFGIHQNPITLEFHALLEATAKNRIGVAAFNTTGFTNSLIIPNYYTGIEQEAFAYCPRIPSVSIYFGHQAENPSNDIGYAYIGESAFEGCGSLTLLSIKSAVCTYEDNSGDEQRAPLSVYINDRAFYGVGINHELVMPLTISYIGNSAFEACKQLRGVVFNYNTGTSFDIGNKAFCNCENLRGEVYIPSGVQTIGESAFKNCNNLNRLTLVLEGNLKSIKTNAFYGCMNLAGSLDIPYKVEEIGSYAFYKCENLGDHLSVRANSDSPSECSLGEHAFDGCQKLKTLDFLPNTDSTGNTYQKLTSIGAECFINTGIICDIYIPYTLQTIDDGAFKGCQLGRLLVNDDQPYQLTYIGESAFQDSTISGDLIIPPSLDHIYKSAFENCRNFGSIIFKQKYNDHDLQIHEKAFYQSSVKGILDIPNYVSIIGESAFENSQLTTLIFSSTSEPENQPSDLNVKKNAFRGSTISGNLYVQDRDIYDTDDTLIQYFNMNFEDSVFSNCQQLLSVNIEKGKFGSFTFENCTMLRSFKLGNGEIGAYSFRECISLNETIILYDGAIIDSFAFADFQYNNITLDIDGNYVSFGYRAFYNSSLSGSLYLNSVISEIGYEAFALCKNLLGDLYVGASSVRPNAFAYSAFNGTLTVSFGQINTYPISYGESPFKGCTGFTDLTIYGDASKNSIPDYAFAEIPFTGVLTIDEDITIVGKYSFQGCGFYAVDFTNSERSKADLQLNEGAFYNCKQLNTTVDMSKCTFTSNTVAPRLFYGCERLPSVIFPENSGKTKVITTISNEAFYGCSSLSIHPDFFLDLTTIGKHSFQGCRSIRGEMYVPTTLVHIDEYAFADCTGLSGRLTIHVAPPSSSSPSSSHTYIGPSAFKGCKGFKDGKLFIFINKNEEEKYIINNQQQNAPFRPYYKYDYFLTIGNEAFEETKFKTVYYNGRFQPECDYDIGFSHTKGIHTSSNYVNKTFCSYPLHSNKLSGGAIAGITIAVIIVVAAIVVLVIFLILRNKKSKDNSEDEVEMNQDP